jgi:type IV secretion system protein VirB4
LARCADQSSAEPCGSLPGHVYANVRQPPISTLNLAHMIPLSAVWAGPARDEHFGAPALFFARTEGATPFRFSLHVGDVGHTLVVGPTGAGKSVLLALMALQFRRYPGAQVFAFDFGGSIQAAALAMGGDWHDLGGALSDRRHARGQEERRQNEEVLPCESRAPRPSARSRRS